MIQTRMDLRLTRSTPTPVSGLGFRDGCITFEIALDALAAAAFSTSLRGSDDG